MKKVAIVAAIIIVFILLYLLQVNFFNWFTIAGIKPNLFIIFVLFIGLFAGRYAGVSLGIFLGLLLDIFISKKIGISAIMLGTIGLLGGILDKSFSKDSKITILIMVVGMTVLYELGSFIINAFIFSYTIDIGNLAIKLAIEVVYNALITIILYPLLQRAGTYIEDTFKENKILTRYF